MTKGLFTSLEEIKFQRDLWRRAHRLVIKKAEKYKPLFTSLEEIKFRDAFVNGNVTPVRHEPNAGKKNVQKQDIVCFKRQNKRSQRLFRGERTR